MPENLMSSDHKATRDSYREGWEATFGCKHENRIFKGSHICLDCNSVVAKKKEDEDDSDDMRKYEER